MNEGKNKFDLEERLIDFSVLIYKLPERKNFIYLPHD